MRFVFFVFVFNVYFVFLMIFVNVLTILFLPGIEMFDGMVDDTSLSRSEVYVLLYITAISEGLPFWNVCNRCVCIYTVCSTCVKS